MAEAAQDDISVGSVLRDTYEITDVLGKGGMGTVFAARHLRLPGKQVAVKVLQGGLATPDMFARFKREAEIVSRLGHPNIVEVVDYHTLEHGTPYLVLELLRGESLHSRLKRGPIPLESTFSILRQVGSALHTAHRAGVVHRDLKPDNIFLVPSDSGGVLTERVKLLDFGISKMADSDSSLKTRDAVLIGTPQYMAPEQAMGKNSEVDARTDVFALGCIAYEMLSGKGPFAGNLIAEVVYRVVHEEPAPLEQLCPGLNPSVVKSIQRAMKKQPSERYGSVAGFISDLTGAPLKTLSNPQLPETIPPTGMGAEPVKPTSNDRPAKKTPAVVEPRALAAASLPGRNWLLALGIALGTLVGIGSALYFRWHQANDAPEPPRTSRAAP